MFLLGRVSLTNWLFRRFSNINNKSSFDWDYKFGEKQQNKHFPPFLPTALELTGTGITNVRLHVDHSYN
jgi:hypothetical protein